MTRTVATIYDASTDSIIADGLQPTSACNEAIAKAREIAAHRNRRVVLLDSDGEWLVGPNGHARKITSRNKKYGHFCA